MARTKKPRRLVQGVAIGVTGAVVAAGCGDSAQKSDDAKAIDAPTTTRMPEAATLLARIAAKGDVGVFDQTFSLSGKDKPALLVGVKGTLAVAYLCDPTRGGRWFSGSVNGKSIELTGSSGGRLSGVITEDSLVATVTGTDTNGGFVLKRTPHVTLSRQSDATGTPGGLIIDNVLVTGSFALPSQLGTIGLRVSAGATLDIGIDLSALRAELERRKIDKAAITQAILNTEAKIRGIEQFAQQALAQAKDASECEKTWSLVGAVVLLVVAIVVLIIATLSGIGAGGTAPGSSVPISSIVTELQDALRAADPHAALLQYLRTHDRSEGQVISKAVDQGLARLKAMTQIPERVLPEPGKLTVVLA